MLEESVIVDSQGRCEEAGVRRRRGGSNLDGKDRFGARDAKVFGL